MTRRRSSAAALLMVASLALTVPQQLAGRQDRGRRFSYEQAFGFPHEPSAGLGSGAVLGDLPSITKWLDGERYLETRSDLHGSARLFAVEAATGRAAVYLDYREIQKDLPSGFSAREAVATSPHFTGFVFEHENDLYYLDAPAHRFKRLTTTPAAEETPRFSPDGKWVAYTRGHNLFAYDLTNSAEHQYTSDGSETVYSGWASWVYYEEIFGRASRHAAFWWSPDSSRLAFMRFDDGPVPVFPLESSSGERISVEEQRYPKAGDPNPLVAVGIVPVAAGAPVWMDFDPKADHYLGGPIWIDGRTLMVQWMNRGQDTIRFYSCDAHTGKKTQIFEQKQPTWVEFFESVHFLADGSGFLLRSSVDGWEHLSYYNPNGTLRRQLTSGGWRVSAIAAVDEPHGVVYFTGRPGKSWDVQLMRVNLDGGGLEQLTTGPGVHDVLVSPGGKYFIDTVSTVTTPASRTLYRGDGMSLRALGDRRSAAADEYAWGTAELFTIPSGDGYNLPACWVLPPDFDPTRRYPVMFTVYGGPDTENVQNRWLGIQPHYWAQRGVISISVDHRGSGHFGRKAVALMHRNLGKWETADLMAAARWLQSKPFVAGDRIGITGSSYGGYVTLMALTIGADQFSFGQATSPVTDWRLYDSVYTERYMDAPTENPEGYRRGDVLTWINQYKGGLRLTHGTIDDNVHLVNSIRLIDWLTSNNRPFELMLYPQSRHTLQFLQLPHSTREMHDFWMRTLLRGAADIEPQEPETGDPGPGTRN